MKIALKVFITIFCLATMGMASIVYIRDGKDAKAIKEIEALGSLGESMGDAAVGGDMPSSAQLTTASYLALLSGVFALALLVVAYLKDPKKLLTVAVVLLLTIIAAYFLHPAYDAGSKADNRSASLTFVIPGALAALLGLGLAQKNKAA